MIFAVMCSSLDRIGMNFSACIGLKMTKNRHFISHTSSSLFAMQ